MEVMLEIYKTLGILGMQWRKKEGINMPEIGPPPAGGYTEEVDAAIEQWTGECGIAPVMGKRSPGKKDVAAQDKAAQGLYLVETRARYGEIMVCPPFTTPSALLSHSTISIINPYHDPLHTPYQRPFLQHFNLSTVFSFPPGLPAYHPPL